MIVHLGSAAHGVPPPHGSSPHPPQPVHLILLGVINPENKQINSGRSIKKTLPIITPRIEEHLTITMECQVHLDIVFPAQNKVTNSSGFRLRECLRSPICFCKIHVQTKNLEKYFYRHKDWCWPPWDPICSPNYGWGPCPDNWTHGYTTGSFATFDQSFGWTRNL